MIRTEDWSIAVTPVFRTGRHERSASTRKHDPITFRDRIACDTWRPLWLITVIVLEPYHSTRRSSVVSNVPRRRGSEVSWFQYSTGADYTNCGNINSATVSRCVCFEIWNRTHAQWKNVHLLVLATYVRVLINNLIRMECFGKPVNATA